MNSHFELGHMVFVNDKMNKFLLVNSYGPDPYDPCGAGHTHISYPDLLKTQANLIYCTMKYMGI